MDYDEPKPIKPTVETCLKSISDVRLLIATQFTKTIAEQEQTISQLRCTVERLRQDKDEYFRQNIELREEVDGLQTEIIGLREDKEDLKVMGRRLLHEKIELQQELKTQLPAEHSLEWAIGQMRQGKKVRHIEWTPAEFIALVGETIQDEFEYGYTICGIDLQGKWELFVEPEKELKVGQCWEDSWGKKREIIAIRNGIVSYFYNGRDMPDYQSEKFFLDSSAHKLLGDV